MNTTPLSLFSPQEYVHESRTYYFYNSLEFDNNAYSAPLNTCALLSHLAVVKISGADAHSFLQGQLTLNIDSGKEIGCYLSRKGRIIALFYFIKHENSYYLLIPKDITTVFVNQLKKYIFMSKVEVTVLTDYVASIGHSLFNKFEESFLSGVPNLKINDEHLVFLNDDQMKYLHESYLKHNFTLLGDWAWHKKQLISKIPSFYPETVAKFLIHDLELEAAVDFKKGCYIGQEIVARMHYKAKLNYQLSTITDSSHPLTNPGSELILNDIKQGMVIDSLSDSNQNHSYLICHKKSQLIG